MKNSKITEGILLEYNFNKFDDNGVYYSPCMGYTVSKNKHGNWDFNTHDEVSGEVEELCQLDTEEDLERMFLLFIQPFDNQYGEDE